MKISASQLAAARAARPAAPAPAPARAADPVRAHDTDTVDLSKDGHGREVTGQGQSTSERVASFAENVHQRLEHLARSLDPSAEVDLGTVKAEFAQNVQRLQDGIAAGAFSDEQLATGVQNTLSLLTGGVREALGLAEAPRTSDAAVRAAAAAGDADAAAPSRASGLSPAERISALEDKVNERIAGLMSGLDPDIARGVQAVQAQFAEHVARVQAGLESGSLDPEDIARGMQSTLGLLAQGLREALPQASESRAATGADPAPAPGADPAGAADADPVHAASADPGGAAAEARAAQQARFGAFADKVAARLADMQVEGADARLVGQAASAFESHMQRLEHAFFEQGSLDREQFGELFSSMLGQLQKDLAAALKPEHEGVRLYGADLGVDALKAGASSFDVEV
jgi:hypothetical protein